MSIMARALLELAPGAEWTTHGETVDDIIWHDEVIAKPSDEAISTKIEELTNGEPLRKLRVVRDTKLSQTDWWASSDLTMTEAQTAYRQALRDITQHYQSLDEVVWPEKP
jgi:hypothetical protein